MPHTNTPCDHFKQGVVVKSHENRTCVVGLIADPERLADIRRNRVAIMRETNIKDYTNLNFIKDEVNKSIENRIVAFTTKNAKMDVEHWFSKLYWTKLVVKMKGWNA